jgi:serine protease AprX
VQDFKGSVLSNAADNAFESGSAVIAPAGNYGPDSGTVRSPGEAHKAIAVGAVNYNTQVTITSQGRGPESDGRIKPDIQGPTDVECASNDTFTDILACTGTSGSTPFIGGAATLLGWHADSEDLHISPGWIYAMLIVWGNSFPPTSNVRGSGILKMEFGGLHSVLAGVQIGPSQQIDVSFNIPPPAWDLTAALWWAEVATQTHNNIDLRIVDPSGIVRATSNSIPSVFEKTRVLGALAGGNWKLRISRGAGGAAGPQTVWLSSYAKASEW